MLARPAIDSSDDARKARLLRRPSLLGLGIGGLEILDDLFEVVEVDGFEVGVLALDLGEDRLDLLLGLLDAKLVLDGGLQLLDLEGAALVGVCRMQSDGAMMRGRQGASVRA